jgi:hypothetical protein
MARGKASTHDLTTLQMALVGYELEKQKIDQKIQEIQTQLKIKRGRAAAKKEGPAKKRTLSAAARRRIAAAQKRRWAEHRKKMAQAAS